MTGRFEGWYFKHRRGGLTLSVIAGRSSESAFIQVITGDASWQADYPLSAYRRGKTLQIGGSEFSRRGIRLAVEGVGRSLRGTLAYGALTPLRGDIMGPFQYLPMECRHTVLSMGHSVSGSLVMDGGTLDFDGGTGYIEGDSGRSFPADYAWVQCNDFPGGGCAVMASAARIPFCGLHFRGCISAIILGGREYRLATYRGARVLRCDPGVLSLGQGAYRLEVTAKAGSGHALAAPRSGVMSRIIRENAACPAHFRFTRAGRVLFEGESPGASYEYVPPRRFET